MKTPITIINGPLGCGKTSLIHKLLKSRNDSNEILWLKTEFGDDSIDQYLLQDTGVKTADLVGGCICHVLLSDFDRILSEIKDKNFKEIIIETSGMSHPVPVITIIRQHEEFVIKHMALIVDAQSVVKDNYPKPMLLPDGSSAPYQSIVFNKYPQNLSVQQEGALEKILDPWYAGVYDTIEKFMVADDVKNINVSNWAEALQNSQETEYANFKDNNIHIYEDHEGENIETKSFYIDKGREISREEFEQLIDSAPENIVRVKGLIPLENGKTSAYNWVRGNGNWQELQEKPDKLVLIVMGYNFDNAQDFLQKIQETVQH